MSRREQNRRPLTSEEAGLIRADYLRGALYTDLTARYHRSDLTLRAVLSNERFPDPGYSVPMMRRGPREPTFQKAPARPSLDGASPQPPTQVQRCPHCRLRMLHVEVALPDERAAVGLWYFRCAACGREFGPTEVPELAVAS